MRKEDKPTGAGASRRDVAAAWIVCLVVLLGMLVLGTVHDAARDGPASSAEAEPPTVAEESEPRAGGMWPAQQNARRDD